MGIQGSPFRTRVARRIVLLFVACSLLPISALAVVSYSSVRSQLLTESRARLRDMAKNAHLALAERFLCNRAPVRNGGSSRAGGCRWAR